MDLNLEWKKESIVILPFSCTILIFKVLVIKTNFLLGETFSRMMFLSSTIVKERWRIHELELERRRRFE